MGGTIDGIPSNVGYNLNADVVKASVPLYGDAKIDTNLGLDVGSSVGVGDASVSGKVLGVGATVGRKVGISTPIGSFSFKLW